MTTNELIALLRAADPSGQLDVEVRYLDPDWGYLEESPVSVHAAMEKYIKGKRTVFINLPNE